MNGLFRLGLLVALIAVGIFRTAAQENDLSYREQIENSFVLLSNHGQIIPFVQLDTLHVAAIWPSGSNFGTFGKMLNNYMKVDTFQVKAGQSALQLKPYRFIIAVVQTQDEWEMVQSTIPAGSKTGLVVLGKASNFQHIDSNDNESFLLYSENDDLYAQQVAAEIIFGGVAAKGKLATGLGKQFSAGEGIETSDPIRLKYSIPEEAGLNGKQFSHRIDSIVGHALEKKAFPGCNVLVARKGMIIFRKAYGYQTFEHTTPASVDDLYDLASVTKISGGAPGILKLYDEGKIDLDRPVADYYPEWRKRFFHPSDKSDITLRELYAHQSGLVPFIGFWKRTLQDGKLSAKWYRTEKDGRHTLYVAPNIWLKKRFTQTVNRQIRKTPLKSRGKYVYSDLPLVITPKIVEKSTQVNFVKYLDDNFYRPLGATTLTYKPLDKFQKERIAPTELDNYYRFQQIQGSVHDESAAVMGGISGNAGLFANANDLAKLMQMYLQMGEYGGKRYVSEATMKVFTQSQFPESGNRRGIIFDKPLIDNQLKTDAESYPCKEVSAGSFGHSGFTGTFVWIDPKEELLYIFLSNRVFPTRENNLISDLNVRTAILSAIYKSIKFN